MGDTLVFRLSQKVLGVAVGAVVAGSGLTGSQAQAIVVTVNSQAWEVTTFTGTYNDNVSKFSATDMPWWDNSTLAGQFAVAVGNQFGTPNSGANQFADLLLPPYFAFSLTSFWVGLPQYFLVVNIFVNPSNPIFLPGCPRVLAYPCMWNAQTAGTYATATLASSGSSGSGSPLGSGVSSVPGPLPILGLAAAFGFSRKLRKRIKLHKGTSYISTSPGA